MILRLLVDGKFVFNFRIMVLVQKKEDQKLLEGYRLIIYYLSLPRLLKE